MADRTTVPRETNPLVLFLAELAVSLAERQREVDDRRRTIHVVGARGKGRNAA